LQTPVIRNVERLGLLDLAREVERLKTAARGGSLSLEDVRGGTFTVSNLGTRGGVMGTPMLNVPQVAILGIHRIEPRPAVRGGEIVPRQMANVSLTLDHRYIDGYVGGGFSASLKSCLEDPAVLLFWLAELREEP
jgi:pyruvate/2-oxoglutarate dehydrogenase complex dihydrolipoamide acyltransferase (E2) component